MKLARMLALTVGVVAFGALALSASAIEFDQLVVRVPYDFVVSGKTLPAGTYKLSRVDAGTDLELILRNVDNSTGVLIVPSETEQPRDGKLAVSFEQIGQQHFLTRVATPEHVFNFPVSKSNILQATNKPPQSSSVCQKAGD